MQANPNPANQAFWFQQSKLLNRKVNVAWWLQTLTPPMLVVSLITGASFIWLRQHHPTIPTSTWLISALTILVALAVVSAAIAYRKFESVSQSMVRLEAAMRLNNSLSAAAAGVCSWPDSTPAVHSGLTWKWLHLLTPIFGSTLFLIAGILIPVSNLVPPPAQPAQGPQAWQQLNSELEKLEQENLVDPSYLEETKKQLEQLQAQPEEQWFSHSSLEATDHIKNQHRAEMQRVQDQLAQTGNALNQITSESPKLNELEMNRQLQAFQQAVDALNNGSLKPNPELLAKLENAGAQNLSQLSPEQLQQLKNAVQQCQKGMQEAQSGEGSGEGEGEGDADGEGSGDGKGSGEGAGEGEGDTEGDGPGKGGVSRGPGHSDKLFGKSKDLTPVGDKTGIESKDLSKSSLGDLMEMQTSEHEVNKEATQATQGGQIKSNGAGGDRVWKDNLSPTEQRAVKKFFD